MTTDRRTFGQRSPKMQARYDAAVARERAGDPK
jgi:hypothetical protein